MTLGDAFLLNTIAPDDHIWFIAYHSDTSLVVFNFTSWKLNKDHSCIIKPEEYSELKHTSIVEYRFGRLVEGKSIQNLEQYGIRKVLTPVPSDVLSKVADGACHSEFTASKIKRFFTPTSD